MSKKAVNSRWIRVDGRLIRLSPPRLRVFKDTAFWCYEVNSPTVERDRYEFEQNHAVSWHSALELGLKLAGLT